MNSFMRQLTYRDGTYSRIRHDYLPDGEQKAIYVYFVGRGIAIEHHEDAIQDALKRGRDAVTVEMPGQGGSGRFLDNEPAKSHVESYDQYTGPMEELHESSTLEAVFDRGEKLGIPVIGISHSNGAMLLLRETNKLVSTVDRRPAMPTRYAGRAYINPPIELNFKAMVGEAFYTLAGNGALIRLAARLGASLLTALGQGERYAPGESQNPIQYYKGKIVEAEALQEADRRCRRDGKRRPPIREVVRAHINIPRYKARLEVLERIPEYAMTGATIGWFRALAAYQHQFQQETFDRAQRGPAFDGNQAMFVSGGDKLVNPDAAEGYGHMMGMKVSRVEGAIHDPTMDLEKQRTAMINRIHDFSEEVIRDYHRKHPGAAKRPLFPAVWRPWLDRQPLAA